MAVGRTLMAASRSSRVSRARYTSPIPPAPTGARITYGPNLSPAESGIPKTPFSLSNQTSVLLDWAIRKLSLRTPRPTERDSSSGLLPTDLPMFPGGLQLPVPFRVDLLLPPRQHVLRRDIARRAVQSDVVVVVHVSAYQTPGIIERQRRSWPDALPFDLCQRSIFPFD